MNFAVLKTVIILLDTGLRGNDGYGAEIVLLDFGFRQNDKHLGVMTD